MGCISAEFGATLCGGTDAYPLQTTLGTNQVALLIGGVLAQLEQDYERSR